MQEGAHNHVADHAEVVDPDVEVLDEVDHLLVGKMLDLHEEQEDLEVDLHVLGDHHVLVVDLLDLKQTSCQTQKSSFNYTVSITVVRQVLLGSTSLLLYNKITQLFYLKNQAPSKK
jgi:hypothetical protein